jgi:hypothetical protein
MAGVSFSTPTLTHRRVTVEVSAYHRELAALLAPIDEHQRSWASLIAHSQGATPLDVALALQMTNASQPHGWPECAVSGEQPELHLADAEWYFSSETARSVAAAIRPNTGRVVCIGTPTVARMLAAVAKHPVLIDRSDALRDRLDSNGIDLICRDVATMHESSCRGSFASVVFDAPWHLDDVAAWLWHASRLARTGARIAFALFPALAKSSARDERFQILELCEDVGRVWITPGVVEYDTPLFEREAFRAVGVPAPTRWRRADLVEISKRRALSGAAPRPRRQRWETFIIGAQVVKIRRGGATRRGGILPGLPGTVCDVLPSVSRSHSTLPYIDLWTSRNRVSSVGNHGLVRAWLAALAAGSEKVVARSVLEAQALRRLKQLLLDT